MAPNSKKTYFDLNAEERKNIPLLQKFLCRECNKWKAPEGFSKKEHRDWQFRSYNNPSMNGVRAKLRCRKCIGEPLQERLCQGQCGTWKSLDKFSKAQRSGNSYQWCQECILWKEAAEPTMAPVAAPGTADETSTQSTYYSDPENGGESDDDTGFTNRPWQGFSTMSLEDQEDKLSPITKITSSGPDFVPAATTSSSLIGNYTAGNGSASKVSTIQRGYVPPPIRGMKIVSVSGASTPSNMGGSVGGVYQGPNTTVGMTGMATKTDYIPAYMRVSNNTSEAAIHQATPAQKKCGSEDLKSQSSISNPYEDGPSSKTNSQGGWSVVDARRKQAVTYNAYDPLGQIHVQHRIPSDETSQSAPSGWGRKNWAKPVGSRTPKPQYPAAKSSDNPTKCGNSNYYDSDGEDDDM